MQFLSTLSALAIAIPTAILLAIPTAGAAEQRGVGEAIAVIDVASASGQIGDRPLRPGAKIFVGDRVVTQSTGKAEIQFSDDTRVVVGSNASMTFEELLMNSNTTGSEFTMKLGGGAFRFKGGRTPSKGYRIRTPDATISPRGTVLDIAVTDSLRTWLIVLEGGARLCDAAGNCVETEERCSVLRTSETGAAELLAPDEAPPDDLGRNFPYLDEDSDLDSRFRVEDHGCGVRQGGLAKFSLKQPGLRRPVRLFLGAAGIGAALCALTCAAGPSTPSTISTTSNTN